MNRFWFLLPTGINPELLVSTLFGAEPPTIPVWLAFLSSQWKEEFSTSPGRFLLLAYVFLFCFFFFLWEEIMWAMLAMKRYTVYKVLTFSYSTNKLGIVLLFLFLDRYKSVMIPVSDRLPRSITDPRKSLTLGAVLVHISILGFWLGLLWVMWWREELGLDLSLSLLTTSIEPWHPGHSFHTVKVLTPKGQPHLSSEF